MKTLLLLSLIILFKIQGFAQQKDTLSNLEAGVQLYAPKYTGPSQWGYLLGQNSAFRQQFGEKYHLSGENKIYSVITHLKGSYKNPHNFVEFNIYNVGKNGFPDSKIGGKQIAYKDLDLSGNAFEITFPVPVSVKDSFFVTFNVQDYLHGGFEGDTIGLLMGVDGSRKSEDLRIVARNVVQAHNHSKEDWRDFYTQNFTPVRTHFALFPVTEAKINTYISDINSYKDNVVIFPNPCSDILTIDLPDRNTTGYNIDIRGVDGALIKRIENLSLSESSITLNVDDLEKGIYYLVIYSQSIKELTTKFCKF